MTHVAMCMKTNTAAPKTGKPNIFSHSVYLGVLVHSCSVHSLVVLFCLRNGSERLKKGYLCEKRLSNAQEEGFAKQTQVMLLQG
jgi:hypothetical protein